MNEDDAIYLNVPNTPQSVPIANPSDRADILRAISPERHPELMRSRFLGEALDSNGNPVKVTLPDICKLSEVGAWDITTTMLSVGSIGTSISKLDDKEIKQRLHRIVKEVLYKSLARWRVYNINDVSMFYTIKEVIFTQGLTVLKQADDASIQDLIKAVKHEQLNYSGEIKREGRLRRMANSMFGR